MIIKKLQFSSITEEDEQMLPNFLEFLRYLFFNSVITPDIQNKMFVLIKYLEKKNIIPKDSLSLKEFLDLILYSTKFKKSKANQIIIEIDRPTKFKGTNKTINSIIKFINSGNKEISGTRFLLKLEEQYSANQLNKLWKSYVMSRVGYIPASNILEML